MRNRKVVKTYSHLLYSHIRVLQQSLLGADIWPYIIFRCTHGGNLRGIGFRLCRSLAGLYPLPRHAWHLSAINQYYAVFCDGFSFAENVARHLGRCTCPHYAFHGTWGLCLWDLYANYSGMQMRCIGKCRQRK